MRKTLAILLLTGTILGAGCGNSEDFVFTAAQGTISAPVCAADAYTTNANTALTVPAATGVLANDTPNGATLAFSATSAQGGTVTAGQGGGFTYTPPANFNGTDTFTYTLANSGGAVTCTVTITVVAVNGFFVDAATGNDTTGSFTNGLPFATIQAAVTAAGTNQTIVVRPGTYNGNITLLNGQRLLGSGSSLITPQGVSRPVINGAGITLADGNTIDFLRIQNTPGDAIFGNGVNGATISNCEIANTTNIGDGIRDERATGTWNITNNNIDSTDSIGIMFRGITGDNLVTVIRNNVITNNIDASLTFSYGGSGTVRAQVVGNTMTGTVNPGATFEVIAGNAATMCFDITGNTNDDRYRFSSSDATATIQVEQLSQLLTLNSGAATVGNGGGTTFPAVEVADGFCGF